MEFCYRTVCQIAVVSLLVIVLVGCGSGADSGPATKTIGVSLLSQSQDFYKDLESGLRSEAEKHGYRLIVQSAEFDQATQARQLEDFVTQMVDAIVVCPCDSDSVATSLKVAEQAGVPVFTADIAAKGATVVTHVASDNYLGGQNAAQAMARLLDGKGQVLVIDHPTVSSVQDRTRGFEEGLAKHAGMTIVAKTSADGQRARAQAVMEDALITHASLSGVFGINDDSALGALRAIEASGRKDIVVIGYDATPEACTAIRRGSALRADVIQYPEKIGSETIAVIARHFAGEKVPALVPVEVGIVDRKTLEAQNGAD